jgi:hypothetical protein
VAVAPSGCSGPKNYDDFRHQLDARWCDYQVRCGQLGASERQHCGVPPVLATLTAGRTDLGGAIRRGSVQFHPGNAQDCLDAVAHASCDPQQAALSLGRACHGIGTALLAVGHACLGSAECQGGACVSTQAGCGGTCVAWAPTGAACLALTADPTQACDPTVHYCDGVCRKKKQPGDACPADVECAFDFVCVDGKCGDPPELAQGNACSGNTPPPCREGLYCNDASVCAPRVDRGQSCTSDLGCKDGLACIDQRCGSWLDVGAACTQLAGGGLVGSGCPQSTDCLQNSCMQAMPPPNGPDQPCGSQASCSDGLHCSSGVCIYVSELGGGCANDTSCATGLRCDAKSGSCLPISCPAAQ